MGPGRAKAPIKQGDDGDKGKGHCDSQAQSPVAVADKEESERSIDADVQYQGEANRRDGSKVDPGSEVPTIDFAHGSISDELKRYWRSICFLSAMLRENQAASWNLMRSATLLGRICRA